jgi:hypothetical protein
VLVYRKGIFCLESEWFGLRSSVSVRPALDLLKATDYRVPYIHRDVATREEMEHYLRRWFHGKHDLYDILWISMHSRKGLLLPGNMRKANERISLDSLEGLLAGKCRGRLIHFGGCRTIAVGADRIRSFLSVTGAACVSGFQEEVEWTESTFFELAYLLELQKHPLTPRGLQATRRALRRLRPIECTQNGFTMHIRKP